MALPDAVGSKLLYFFAKQGSSQIFEETGSRASQDQKACLKPVVELSDSTVAGTFSPNAESLQLQGQRLCFHSG